MGLELVDERNDCLVVAHQFTQMLFNEANEPLQTCCGDSW